MKWVNQEHIQNINNLVVQPAFVINFEHAFNSSEKHIANQDRLSKQTDLTLPSAFLGSPDVNGSFMKLNIIADKYYIFKIVVKQRRGDV